MSLVCYERAAVQLFTPRRSLRPVSPFPRGGEGGESDFIAMLRFFFPLSCRVMTGQDGVENMAPCEIQTTGQSRALEMNTQKQTPQELRTWVFVLLFLLSFFFFQPRVLLSFATCDYTSSCGLQSWSLGSTNNVYGSHFCSIVCHVCFDSDFIDGYR